MFTWRTLIGSNNPKFMVKGHELAVTFYKSHRFAIYEVRTLEADGYCSTAYRVRDAHTVSDAEVREGVRPKVVGERLTWDEAVALCDKLSENSA